MISLAESISCILDLYGEITIDDINVSVYTHIHCKFIPYSVQMDV